MAGQMVACSVAHLANLTVAHWVAHLVHWWVAKTVDGSAGHWADSLECSTGDWKAAVLVASMAEQRVANLADLMAAHLDGEMALMMGSLWVERLAERLDWKMDSAKDARSADSWVELLERELGNLTAIQMVVCWAV